MRNDTAAVGGFFEDLPVLMFVLAGVSLLVFSYVWTSQTLASEDALESLNVFAERLLNEVVAEVEGGASCGRCPLLSGFQSLNLSAFANRVLADGMGCAMTIAVLHPGHVETLASATIQGHATAPISTGYAHTLMNAISDDGMICIVEVRVIVW